MRFNVSSAVTQNDVGTRTPTSTYRTRKRNTREVKCTLVLIRGKSVSHLSLLWEHQRNIRNPEGLELKTGIGGNIRRERQSEALVKTS